MKGLKISVLVLLMLLTVQVWGEKRKFVIQGKVPELATGKMILLTRTLYGWDTLAQAPLQNGTFRMEGTLEAPVVALMTVEKYQGGFTFLLDTEKTYSMELYQNKKSVIEGGKLQKALVTYQEIVEKSNDKIKLLKEQIRQAEEVRHYKTKKELQNKLKAFQDDAYERLQAMVEKNKDNIFAAYIQTLGLEQVVELNVLKNKYAGMAERARQTPPGQILAARIKDLEKVNVSAIAPDFTLTTPEGKEVSLYGVKGKLKIIDFWASWCGPCRMENPNMVKLYQDFKSRGLAIISVSLDTKKEKWVEAIEKDGMPWVHVSSLQGWKSEVVKMYGFDAVPSIFILDENNRILAKQLRGKELREFVSGYLK